MKNITYKNITIFLVFMIFIVLNTGTASAVLQANGNTGVVCDLNTWMLNVRKMEEAGGAMGLQETVNSDLTSSSTSNNIDVHMEKNTEYGALVILSASSYGNPNVIIDGQTTTGNATGVVMNINKELVAAATGISKVGYFQLSVARYKNVYETSYVAKKGDAITETGGWHGSSGNAWFNDDDDCVLTRSWSGGVFSFYGVKSGSGGCYYIRPFYSRAVVVSGQGL